MKDDILSLSKETKITGRVWALTDPEGKLYDDIDTDMIFHNRYLHITDVERDGPVRAGQSGGLERFRPKGPAGRHCDGGQKLWRRLLAPAGGGLLPRAGDQRRRRRELWRDLQAERHQQRDAYYLTARPHRNGGRVRDRR